MQRYQKNDAPNVQQGDDLIQDRVPQARRHDQHIHFPDSLYGRTRVAWQTVTCAGLSATTVGKQVPAGHVCGLESCPSKYLQHVWSRTRITGNRAMGLQKGQCLNHSRHF